MRSARAAKSRSRKTRSTGPIRRCGTCSTSSPARKPRSEAIASERDEILGVGLDVRRERLRRLAAQVPIRAVRGAFGNELGVAHVLLHLFQVRVLSAEVVSGVFVS